MPFPKVPDFDQCSFQYQKQRTASLVMLEHVAELSREHGKRGEPPAGLDLLASNAMALDPTSHPNASAQRFEGLAGRLPQPAVSPCPPRPKLQGRVIQATRVEEVTLPSLLRLCLWYDKPLVVCCLADTPFKPLLRSIFLKVTEPFLDRAVFVLAEDPELYEYATTQHINTLKGTRITYYVDHAMRALNPTDSFNWGPINHRLDDQAGLTKFLEEHLLLEATRRDTVVPCAGREGEAARRKRRPSRKRARAMLKEAAKGELPLPPRPATPLQVPLLDPLPMENFAAVPRLTGVSSLEFVHRYFLRGHPVVLTDGMDSWPAFKTWNRVWMNKRFKKEIVEDGYRADDDVASNWIVASPLLRKKLARWYSLPYLWNLGCREGNCTDAPLRGVHEGANVSSTAPMAAPYFYGSPNKGYASKTGSRTEAPGHQLPPDLQRAAGGDQAVGALAAAWHGPGVEAHGSDTAPRGHHTMVLGVVARSPDDRRQPQLGVHGLLLPPRAHALPVGESQVSFEPALLRDVWDCVEVADGAALRREN
jgi:hypothetical protein